LRRRFSIPMMNLMIIVKSESKRFSDKKLSDKPYKFLSEDEFALFFFLGYLQTLRESKIGICRRSLYKVESVETPYGLILPFNFIRVTRNLNIKGLLVSPKIQ
jgi:hypothetical protein